MSSGVASAQPKSWSDTDSTFDVSIVHVTASQRQIDSIPERFRATAIVDGKIAYVVCGDIQNGVDPKQNIGLVIDFKRGFEEGNITINPLFLLHIWQIAREHIDWQLVASIARSESKAVAIVDERVPDTNVPMKDLMDDIIGVYRWENDRIAFDPNPRFAYFFEARLHQAHSVHSSAPQ